MNNSWILMLLILLTCGKPEKAPNVHETATATDSGDSRKEVVVFIYHRFGDDKYPSTNVSIADFDAHLNYLKSTGFTVLSFGAAVEYVTDPSIAHTGQVACITIDDAFKSFYSNGFPLLKKYGFPATVFVNSETIGGGSFMSWDELKTVTGAGIEIGNHTHSHDYFLNMPIPERHKEFEFSVKECQQDLKQHLGISPKVFAYPFGEFDAEMKTIIQKLGFKAAAAQFSGVLYNADLYSISRFPMTGSTSDMKSFIEKANMKALRVTKKTPDTALFSGAKPPTLSITIDTSSVDISRLNCFSSVGCETATVGNTVKISAKNPLSARRTNFTITAPAKSGKGWYWFSHQWVIPGVKE